MKKSPNNIQRIFNSLFITYLFLNITNCLCNIASGYIAGNFLDSIAVSCTSLIYPVNQLITGITNIMASGSQIVCSRFMGTGNKKAINKTFTKILLIAIISGIIITFLSIICAKPIVSLLQASDDMFDAAVKYFLGFSIGITAYIVMPILVSFLQLENEGKYITVSVVILAITYLVIAYVFIKIFNFGYFAFGLTNSLSQILTVLFLFIRILKNRNQIFFDFSNEDTNNYKITDTLQLGIPSGTAGIMIAFRNMYLNTILISKGNYISMAARSISNSSICILDAVSTSILQVILILSSLSIGEENEDDLKNMFKHFICFYFPILIVLYTTYGILAKYPCSFFSNDPACISLAVEYSRLYIPSMFFEIASNVLISIFNIFAYRKFVNILNLLHCIVIHCIFAFLTQNILGQYSVFYGYLFTEIVCFIIVNLFIISQNKKMPKNLNEYLLINGKFTDTIKYYKTISNSKNIINISKDVIEFCSNNGISKKKSNLVGLSVEEMIFNIFDHGFTKKKIKHQIVDLFVLIKGNEVIVRIRDDSVPFDPTSRSIIFNPEDPFKNIGLRIVSKISKEMTYQTLFGTNNMIIKI